MPDEPKVEDQASQNPGDDAEPSQDPSGEDKSPSDKGSQHDEWSKDELVEKNKQLYARAKKAEQERDKIKKATPDGSRDFDIEDIVDLRVDGYSKKEIEEMKAYAKGKGKSLSEVKEEPFIKNAIENMRKEGETKDATPPSKESSSEPLETKQEKSWDEMSDEERRKNFDNVRSKFMGG